MTTRRDPMVIIGLSAVALAAAISSFEALYGVALTAGWTGTMAPMFPITIDATALVATRIWLAETTPTVQARRFARSVAIGAVLVSLLGNAVFHLAQAHVIHPGVVEVIAAGAVPPLALAVVCHLAVLRLTRTDEAPEPVPAALPEQAVPLAPADAVPLSQPGSEPLPVLAEADMPEPPVPIAAEQRPTRARETPSADMPAGDGWDELIGRAAEVNAVSLDATGRPAGIGKLTRELKIGQPKARALRDALAASAV